MKNTSLIRIYSARPHDRGAKARWLLVELGVSFENRTVQMAKQENQTPEYLKLNPMGRVPVMEFGDTAMFESGAICAFLADRYLDRGLAPQHGSPLRAKYEQWMYFASTTLDPIIGRIMIVEDIPEGEVKTKKETELFNEYREALRALDQTLATSPFLVGGTLSVADMCVGYHLFWPTLWPELDAVFKEFPRVVSYLERLKKIPSAIEAKVFSYEG